MLTPDGSLLSIEFPAEAHMDSEYILLPFWKEMGDRLDRIRITA